MKYINLFIIVTSVLFIVITHDYITDTKATIAQTNIPRDEGGEPIQGVLGLGTSIHMVLTDSTTVRSDSLTDCSVVRLYCPNDVWIDMGDYTVTADSSDHLLPGGMVEYFARKYFKYIAARMKYGTTGDTLYVSEME